MSSFTLVRAWLIGPIALAAVALLAHFRAPAPANHFHGATAIAIGSSLSAHGLAEQGSAATSFAPGGSPSWRIGIAQASADQILTLIEAASRERARLVVIEVNPLIAGLAYDAHARCNQPAARTRTWLKAVQLGFVDMLRRLFGARTAIEGMGEPAGMNLPQQINADRLRASYPLDIHAPCDLPRLKKALAAIEAGGGRAVLALPPRAPVGDAWLGSEQSAALRQQALTLAADLQVPLFEAPPPWRNDQFTDHAHLNAAGRASYTAALRAWLEAQQ